MKGKDNQLLLSERYRKITIDSILLRWHKVNQGALTDGIPVSREQAACMVLKHLEKEAGNDTSNEVI